jgi:hypothetical protein
MSGPTFVSIGKLPAIYDPTDPTKLNCAVFERVQVVTNPLGGTMIGWGLKDGFAAKGPLHFFVDFGRSGTHNEWQPLNLAPIIDSCVTFDLIQRHWDQLVDFYYRVRLVTPEDLDASGQCKRYVSQPQQANGLWVKRDWLLAREIIRKEYLMQRKRTNVTQVGWLLKRRRFGQKCTKCKEYITEDVQFSQCPECFGTGFTGGYFKAIDYRITLDAPWSRKFERDGTVGMRNDIVRQGRAVAYPYLDTRDIYVRRDSGERFLVMAIAQAAEVGGIPIVVQAELRLAPTTDIIYTVPLSGGSSSSSSSVSPSGSSVSSSLSSSSSPPAEPCDWRTGLKDDNDW